MVIDALGSINSLLLVGGTSDIAVATAHRYLADRPLRVVLAARDTPRRAAVAEELSRAGARVEVVDLDAEDPTSPARMVAQAAAGGDIDVAVVAFGQLGDAEQLRVDADAVARLGQVNYVAPTVVGTELANLMRRQGHGVIVALSSVAGERVRRSNFVYGSTKAGFDGFYLGLGEALRGTGVRVLVVRPGFVKSRDQLMDVAYDDQVYVDDRTIDSHIKRLRRKFREVDPDFDAIETLYGAGYRFSEG